MTEGDALGLVVVIAFFGGLILTERVFDHWPTLRQWFEHKLAFEDRSLVQQFKDVWRAGVDKPSPTDDVPRPRVIKFGAPLSRYMEHRGGVLQRDRQ